MKKRDIIIAVVVLIVVVGAYMLGTQSGDKKEVSSSRASSTTASSASGGGGSDAHPLTRQAIDYDEVINDLKTRIAADPKNAALHAQTGDVYFSTKHFSEAIAHYKKAVELNPKDVDSYNDLALVFHYIGNSDDAIKYLDQGIEADPTYQRIWLTKGFILSRGFGDSAGAAKAWQEVVNLNPDNQLGVDAASFLREMEKN